MVNSLKRGQIDDLIHEMSKTAIETGRKIYVIHHADQLNASAANTLLKFLEEPQSEITAILLTDRMHALIPTIRSRCQHLSLAAMPQSVLKQRLSRRRNNRFNGFYCLSNDESSRRSN